MELIWRLVAFIVSRRRVADWLIARAQRTPYYPLPGYMERFWLFNGWTGEGEADSGGLNDRRRFRWLPSIRVHHILRADTAEHPHDHPWDARTIILRSGYIERRHVGTSAIEVIRRVRFPGDTSAIRFGEYHHIEHVPAGGTWTLFIMGQKRGKWGFLVEGVKVHWREYERRFPPRMDAEVRHG